jgi:hypothetical protein
VTQARDNDFCTDKVDGLLADTWRKAVQSILSTAGTAAKRFANLCPQTDSTHFT